ncbi:unnamed protein product [Miscanthus lutarioriparius]|uniref:Uncharacterized protein n=1 Tax=Miscanthus lutarioriparius TaxID=422564 RepID=A0A811MWN7_9POAL|nr:unnamed protein product [Miscanthus lutarioriparius]
MDLFLVLYKEDEYKNRGLTLLQVISNGTGRAHACEAGLIRESDAHLDGLPVVGIHPLPSDEPLRPEQPHGADLLHRGARVHLHTQNISNPQPTSKRRHRTVTRRREGKGCGMKRRRGRWRVDKVIYNFDPSLSPDCSFKASIHDYQYLANQKKLHASTLILKVCLDLNVVQRK